VGGRGRRHPPEQRQLILAWIDEATRSGARLEPACRAIGVSPRTLQRWRLEPGGGEDGRHGPKSVPANKLGPEEREQILSLLRSPKWCDLPPSQVVPRLADEGIYVASESTMYRLLREVGELKHRQKSRPPAPRPKEHRADGPEQVFSWDITYLRSSVRGVFFYLYLVLDVWSRKIVGWQVHEVEDNELAAALFVDICAELDLDPAGVVLHADNGGPMKGSTMLSTLAHLGVVASFSRPRVSDDNPYSEALFRTLKYRPEYPAGGVFESLDQARAWIEGFTDWYNTDHRHSALSFVTPAERHDGREAEILRRRQEVYEAARSKHPERWSGSIRDWQPEGDVVLNPSNRRSSEEDIGRAA